VSAGEPTATVGGAVLPYGRLLRDRLVNNAGRWPLGYAVQVVMRAECGSVVIKGHLLQGIGVSPWLMLVPAGPRRVPSWVGILVGPCLIGGCLSLLTNQSGVSVTTSPLSSHSGFSVAIFSLFSQLWHRCEHLCGRGSV